MPLGNEMARFLDGERPNASLGLRLLTGATFGTVFAVFTPIIAVFWLVKGAEFQAQNGMLIRVDLLTLLYPLGAVISGALFSGLVSYRRNRVAASLSGMIALAPWFLAIVVCFDRGYLDWTRFHTAIASFCAVMMGGWLGWFAAHARLHNRSSGTSRGRDEGVEPDGDPKQFG